MTLGRWAIRDVRAVCGERIVDNATVVVDGAMIVEVRERGAAPPGAIDGGGRLLCPGLVDSHSDGLEKEIAPRPAVRFPVDYALASFEGRLRSSGITTIFHRLAFQESIEAGWSLALAEEIVDAVAQRRCCDPAADHCLLYRSDDRDPVALGRLLDRLTGPAAREIPSLVSFDDHAPGRDRPIELRRVAHGPATSDDIEAAVASGARIAQYPVTVEAARAARWHGLAIVMGAPNALRGLSHPDSVSARELVAVGLCDGMASDFMPSALLASAFAVARAGIASLPRALALITSGPAALVGMPDRGRLAPGARADLVLIDDQGRWPAVIGVHRAGARLSVPSFV